MPSVPRPVLANHWDARELIYHLRVPYVAFSCFDCATRLDATEIKFLTSRCTKLLMLYYPGCMCPFILSGRQL